MLLLTSRQHFCRIDKLINKPVSDLLMDSMTHLPPPLYLYMTLQFLTVTLNRAPFGVYVIGIVDKMHIQKLKNL